MGKKTPEINSSSTADIAFLLLCYFLMTTTMDQDKGLHRNLPPMPDPNQKLQDQQINRRNIIMVRINQANRLFAGNEPMEVSMLKEKIKNFLTNPINDPSLPEKVEKEIVVPKFDKDGVQLEDSVSYGMFNVSKGVISLQNDRGTNYSQYIAVQNELVKAINELRNEFAIANFGERFEKLDLEKQEVVKKVIPMSISEAEPKDVSK